MALRESEERYRRLFEVESDAIFLVDCETERIIDANAAALKLYGYSLEELSLMGPVDLSAEPNITRQAFNSGTTHIPLQDAPQKRRYGFSRRNRQKLF